MERLRTRKWPRPGKVKTILTSLLLGKQTKRAVMHATWKMRVKKKLGGRALLTALNLNLNLNLPS